MVAQGGGQRFDAALGGLRPFVGFLLAPGAFFLLVLAQARKLGNGRVPGAPGESAAGLDKAFQLDGRFTGPVRAQQLIQGINRKQGPQVVGDAVEAAAVHDLDVFFLRHLVVQVHHGIHEFRFPGQIHIVGSRFHAGFHHCFTIIQIGAYGGNQDFGLCSHFSQTAGIVDIRFDDAQGAAVGKVTANAGFQALQLAPGAACECPAQRLFFPAVGQIAGGEFTGKAGGAEKYDIEVSLFCFAVCRIAHQQNPP